MKEVYLKKSARMAAAFVIAAMMLLMPFAADSAWAAEGSAGIDAASEVTKGETFTVTVTYSGDYLGRVRGMMKYDTSVLKYLSGGSSKGNGGAVELKRSGDGGNITFSVKFKAVGKGNCRLSLKTYDMYDLDEMDMGNPKASASVRVNAAAPAEEQTDEQDDESSVDDQEKDDEKAGDQEKDDEEAGEQDQDEQEDVTAPDPDEEDDQDTDADDEDGVSDNTKLIFIAIAAAVSIGAVNLIILRSRKKKR